MNQCPYCLSDSARHHVLKLQGRTYYSVEFLCGTELVTGPERSIEKQSLLCSAIAEERGEK